MNPCFLTCNFHVTGILCRLRWGSFDPEAVDDTRAEDVTLGLAILLFVDDTRAEDVTLELVILLFVAPGTPLLILLGEIVLDAFLVPMCILALFVVPMCVLALLVVPTCVLA